MTDPRQKRQQTNLSSISLHSKNFKHKLLTKYILIIAFLLNALKKVYEIKVIVSI